MEPRSDPAHLQAAPGVKWHDGKPFSRQGREVHLGRTDRQGRREVRPDPQEPAQDLVQQPEGRDGTAIRSHLRLGRPQPSFLSILAAGYSPVYACHRRAATCASTPIGTGPFKVVDFSERIDQAGAAIPTIGRRVGPISTRSTGRSCPTAARACWPSVSASWT